MSLNAPPDTLAFAQARPFTAQRNMSKMTVGSAVKVTQQYIATHDPDVKPEEHAVSFYAMNHGMSLIQAAYDPMEPLPVKALDLVEDYYLRCSEMAQRAYHYLLVICTREFRHCCDSPSSKAYKELADKFGNNVANFLKSGQGESGIQQQLFKEPPKANMGQYCGALTWGFDHCSWSSGFGGKKWGRVAECLERFVKGEFSAEMMLDTNWTLAHNGGPIFNKGQLYAMYGHTLMRILDLQRGGQMLSAVVHDKPISQFVTDETRCFVEQLLNLFPEHDKPCVDWFAVEALGSVGKYPKEKEAQASLGLEMSPEAKAAVDAHKQQLEHAKAAKKLQKELDAIEESKKFYYMPNLAVMKTSVVRAAA